ncbi:MULTISPECIES: dihydrofolate reductase family protein [Microbacterium]|uniref:dihydrofolate reductase family protein n=1 Tax=Microbacterium TaxID=33882 RepID=UPI00217D695D|nr:MULTISPECIES: dihydrofolate reductase family protein [Microbacterium]UWF78363.1 dihydrofolate reductase family protein [Microbacterium neungamense]WCM56540.1 dihydrofolate reductase family protein [Microbacterium sp. EF45047]
MTTHYFTATSLDGFIATPEHSLDWLLKQDFDPGGPMSYTQFIESIGALAMGASTYEWVMRHENGRWGYTQPTWVFTHRDLALPDGADVRLTQADVRTVHAEMTDAAGGKDLWIVGGGDLAGQFADAGLLDEVWLQYAPVTLGAGSPVLPRALDLELVDHAHNRGFLCGRYRVLRAP